MITSEVINLNVGMTYSHDGQMSPPHCYNITILLLFPTVILSLITLSLIILSLQ